TDAALDVVVCRVAGAGLPVAGEEIQILEAEPEAVVHALHEHRVVAGCVGDGGGARVKTDVVVVVARAALEAVVAVAAAELVVAIAAVEAVVAVAAHEEAVPAIALEDVAVVTTVQG